MAADAEPGYWQFEVRGRLAEPLAPAAQPILDDLPIVRGHTTDAYLIHAASQAELLFLAPEGALPRFAPVTARRWPSRVLLYQATEFETGIEEEARRAFEDRRSLAGVGGVPSTLRAAFGYALLLRAGQERGVPVSPIEARQRVGEIAEGGDHVAQQRARRSRGRARTTACQIFPTGYQRRPPRRPTSASRPRCTPLAERSNRSVTWVDR